MSEVVKQILTVWVDGVQLRTGQDVVDGHFPVGALVGVVASNRHGHRGTVGRKFHAVHLVVATDVNADGAVN